MPKIIVAGDLVCDNNIVHYPAAATTHYHLLPSRTMMRKRPGGASYLNDIISLACSDINQPVPEAACAPRCSSDLSSCRTCNDQVSGTDISFADNVFQVWSLQEKEFGDKKKVWRISELLGCEKPGTPRPLLLPEPPSEPYILVLDNLGMGSFDNLAALKAFMSAAVPQKIVLKISSLIKSEPLFDLLLDHEENVTVVLTAEALRERGAAISRGLSWDRTIEEAIKEFTTGLSAVDLARFERVVILFGCEGAVSFSRNVLTFADTNLIPTEVVAPRVVLEHFLYHPREHEGAFKAKRPGTAFGATSILTASLVRHILKPEDYPIFVAVGRGLAAVRVNHELGGGDENNFYTDTAHQAIKAILHTDVKAEEKPENIFGSAFNHPLFTAKTDDFMHSDLLHDVTGSGLEFVAAKALEVIYDGVGKALGKVPMASYGDYLTADREEIERINSVRNLIIQYLKNGKDSRPLSIAVFGPPGSGKSFAIKQLAQELFGKDKKPLEFNLSQFGGKTENLHDAFHVVRDASIKGQVPLVFWDEFDSDKLIWLKEFLAPMQDAEFRSGSLTHPFGKAIFVFAGGTKDTFEKFDLSNDADMVAREGFKNVKGPDFVSRLRGFVNVKGPNPVEILHDGEKSGEVPYQELAKREPAHIIRRAMLFRNLLERQRPNLIGVGKKALVGSDVVRGFLHVEKFRHGARSLESLISMSDLADAGRFGGAALPNSDLLRLHVTDDFLGHVQEGQLDGQLTEVLAEACHEAWKKLKIGQGWTYGTDRNRKEHELLIEYAKLTEKGKEANRLTARLTEAKLREIGFQVKRADACGAAVNTVADFTKEERTKLMVMEHDIWLRDHLIKGYVWGATSKDDLKLHMDVAPFDNMPDSEKELDGAIVDAIIPALKVKGYSVIRA
ncbi:MAG: RyR domain-containing protein [Desulfuromonadaceae bacterium]|nr:RyR domain-containing protein [Desulfuromonadaceae bacterium]